MIDIKFARQVSAYSKPIEKREIDPTDYEVIIDSRISEACDDRKHEVIFSPNNNILEVLNKNYKPQGYKVKVLGVEGRDGFDFTGIKLSWYPKQ